MIGAIAGDMVGSVYEHNNLKSRDFELFAPDSRLTDDTVLTVALADAILRAGDYGTYLRRYYWQYPRAGFGGHFKRWASRDDAEPYGSWGNGSAMRVSPVGFAFDDLPDVLAAAEWSAAFTHDHPEGIKGAQATAASILLARQGCSQDEIADYVTTTFGYDLDEPLGSIRTWYRFDVSCQGSVPQAIRAFLESGTFEDALRNAVSIGGDSDTIACIAGGIAEAFHGVPEWIEEEVLRRLDSPMREVVLAFRTRYPIDRVV